MAANQKIRIGILGTASIAQKFISGQKSLGSCEVVAIASRTLDRAKEFATKWGIPKAYGSYDDLINDSQIDLVYIPLPTSLHKEYTIKSAQKGKHVICEKPLAPTYEDALEMVKACLNNKVQFMDGTYWTHYIRTKSVQNHFGEIGRIKTVSSKFCWIVNDEENIRRKLDTEPLGANGDLGWYCLGVILFGFGYELPDKVFGTAHFTSKTTPNLSLTGIMWFADGRSAHYDCTFGEETRQWVDFTGDKGSISLDDFVIPWSSKFSFGSKAKREENISQFTVTHYPGQSREVVVESALLQEQQMIEDMCNIIKSGKIDMFWVEVALKTHLLVCLTLKSATEGEVVSVPKDLVNSGLKSLARF